MKTILIAQQKGGVGKTTCAAHIAWYAHELGLRVLVVDLDTGNLSSSLSTCRQLVQASLLFGGPLDTSGLELDQGPAIAVMSSDRSLANLARMPVEDAARAFRTNLGLLAPHFDLCVVDTSPSMGVGLAAALYSADAVLTPLEVEAFSIQGIQDMIVAVLNARRRNPGLKFLGLVPSRVDGRNPRHVRNLQDLRDRHAKMLSPVVIGACSAIAEALARGVPVWKIRKTSARAAGGEMRALGAFVLEAMEVSA